MKKVRIGAGAAWARDRFDAAVQMVERGNVDYICFDAMSEVTMSAAQVSVKEGTSKIAYDPALEKRLRMIMKGCKERGIKIITSSGWNDPVGAAEMAANLAKELGVSGIKIAAVSGGILGNKIADYGLKFRESGELISDYKDKIVSAELYYGTDGIIEALKGGADIIITTRVVDSALYLAPLVYEFGWDPNNNYTNALGTTIGHLLECGSQAIGGYYVDPGYKEVPDIVNLSLPIAEVTEDLHVYITKIPGAGGLVSPDTLKEQLLYEIGDPENYVLYNLIADFSRIKMTQVDPETVELTGFNGKDRTDSVKVLVGKEEGYMTEEMIIFAGPSALERAEITKDILDKRLEMMNFKPTQYRTDYVGLNSVHREATPKYDANPYEVILRIAAKADEKSELAKLNEEVSAMAVNGPSATGKWAPMGNRIRPVIGMYSTLIDRKFVDKEIVTYYQI